MTGKAKGKAIHTRSLNDLVRDLALSKEAAEILDSRLRKHGFLHSDARATIYRRKNEALIQYFSEKDDFCNNVKEHFLSVGLTNLTKCKPNEWPLFNDSCKRSFECILLHNGNKLASVPIGHLLLIKEHYLTVEMVLEKLRYKKHN